MQDGIIKGTGNSRYLKGAGWPATYEEFKSMAEAGTLPIDLAGINAAGWQQIGTSLSKGNLLSDTTAAKYFESLVGTESVDQVLSLLSSSVINEYTNNLLSDLSAGDTFYLMENGVSTPFIKLQDNYTASGRVLVRRLNAIATTMTNGSTYYFGQNIDTYCNESYPLLFSAELQAAMGTTALPDGSHTRKAWLLNAKELGASITLTYAYGSLIPYFSSAGNLTMRQDNQIGNVIYLTSASNYDASNLVSVSTTGTFAANTATGAVAPAFTLPSTFVVNVVSKLKDIFGNILTISSTQLDSQVQIATGSYTGTGTYGSSSPTSIALPSFTPKLAIITNRINGEFGVFNFTVKDTMNYFQQGTAIGYNVVTNKSTALEWYNYGNVVRTQLNISGQAYDVLFIG